MILLGVQFEDFACFKSRFVPLKPGVQVLVGKNNAGKTALLRGLAALRGLPVGEQQPIEPQLTGYVPSGSSGFGLNVWYALENEDWPLVLQDYRGQQPPFGGQEAKLVLRFRVWPDANLSGLLGGEVQVGRDSLPVIERTQTLYAGRRFDESSRQARSGGVQLGISAQRQGPGGPWAVLTPSGLLAKIPELAMMQLVDARRVVLSNLQAAEQRILTSEAGNLAQFLLTLQNSDRKKFDRVQEFLTKSFPEFDALNPELRGDRVSLNFTLRGTETKIPLTHCGSGVEQLLTLATFLLTVRRGTTILVDEPHTYLHPKAEREFISMLMSDNEHRYIISTHSAILMNSVPADRIVNVVAGEEGSFKGSDADDIRPIWRSLGYENSDFLLFDRLIFCEGSSDAAVLPILLKNANTFPLLAVDRTGFPITEGADSPSSTVKQTIILRYEKLLARLDMSSVPRLYFRDGDASADERSVLKGTRPLGGAMTLPLAFLPRTEIENYLIVPDAIARAMSDLKRFEGDSRSNISIEGVAAQISGLLQGDDPRVFPQGRGEDQLKTCKGSYVMEQIFSSHGLRYNKKGSGPLVAEHVTPSNQPALSELVELLRPLYEPSPLALSLTDASLGPAG